ncbi:divalent-cation tolerance protein CutA [Candidatus Woesearchaeota archaeon]|nr:divalent-cation tolerance protein CutA [Candidatus Woesearchaeota archaeon]
MGLIYITCKDEKEARKIAKHLLEKKLIACANFFPINSMYWWEGKIEDDKEFLLLAKTTKKNANKVKDEVKKVHSYDVPCILEIDVDGNKEYIDWVDRVTS